MKAIVIASGQAQKAAEMITGRDTAREYAKNTTAGWGDCRHGLWYNGERMLKRVADWMEKISAGSMLIGMFQLKWEAITIGALAFGVVLYMQWREKRCIQQ